MLYKQLGIYYYIIHVHITTVVANKGLEKARAHLNQVPRD